jgi:hypothetical protein
MKRTRGVEIRDLIIASYKDIEQAKEEKETSCPASYLR